MRKQNVSIGLFILLFSFTTVMAGENVKGQVRQLLQTETLKRADAALESVPMTVTATAAYFPLSFATMDSPEIPAE